MLQWLEANSSLLVWLGALSIVSLVLAALLLPVLVVRLPADYFVAARGDLAQRRGVVDRIGHVGKNLLGVAFVLAGIAMLLLPGQGLLTILMGLLMVDFPGKRALERRIVRRPAILRAMNRLRERRGKPPLLLE